MRKHQTLDFTSINIRLDNFKYRVTKDGYVFKIKNIFIEHVTQQLDELVALKTEIIIGDALILDTYFGWHYREEWLTFPLKCTAIIRDINPVSGGEIKLTVTPITLVFPF